MGRCIYCKTTPWMELRGEGNERGWLRQGGREREVLPFNSKEGDTPFILQDDEGPHPSITRRKTLMLFILQVLWGVNKDSERERERKKKKGLFLGLQKSVTVLQSSRIWKTVIHHCLASLDTRLWPWAINSITDVLRQLRLNNYTAEERTFSTRPASLMHGYKYG